MNLDEGGCTTCVDALRKNRRIINVVASPSLEGNDRPRGRLRFYGPFLNKRYASVRPATGSSQQIVENEIWGAASKISTFETYNRSFVIVCSIFGRMT